MDILDKYNFWNENLRIKYEKMWPEAKYHIWDGVISPADYYKAPVKILFLNKEAYDEDSYDLSKALKEELESNKPIFKNYPIKYNIKNRMSVLRFLGRSDFSRLQDDDFCNYSENDFYKDLLKTAYCNIKKSDGFGRSNKRNLRKCFLRNKKILEEQISFYNPTLIVGGNVVEGIIENDLEWGENLYISESRFINIYQLKIKDKIYPFLDMYHPANSIDHSIDRTELFKALKHLEEDSPGYWEKRCGSNCFNLVGED